MEIYIRNSLWFLFCIFLNISFLFPAYSNQIDNAKKFATTGGNVIYLDYRGKLINDWKPRKLPEKQIASQFPYNMAIINTNGLWQSSMHLLKDHPIFEGITENDHMDEVFENIGATKSFFKPEGKFI